MNKHDGILKFVGHKDIKLLEENPEEFWKGVQYIGPEAFMTKDTLQRIEIPEGVKAIGENAFFNCSNLKEVILQSTLKIIKKNAFTYCEKLQHIVIPEGITKLNATFGYCTGLKTVQLPHSLKKIGDSTFLGCSQLEKVLVRNKDITPEKAEILYYKDKAFSGIIENLETIGRLAFKGCEKLTSIGFMHKAVKVSQDAFIGCDSLKDKSFLSSFRIVKYNMKQNKILHKTKDFFQEDEDMENCD